MKKWVLKRATTLGAWVSMYEQREMNARQVMKVVEGGGEGMKLRLRVRLRAR